MDKPVDMVAVGSTFAGAHILQLDGAYGGTGAAPEIAKKNIAMPIEYAIPKVHRFLINEGVREQMCFMASGGIRKHGSWRNIEGKCEPMAKSEFTRWMLANTTPFFTGFTL